jgi:hypothetical protein
MFARASDRAAACAVDGASAERDAGRSQYPAMRHRAMTKRASFAEAAEDQLVEAANAIWADDPGISCCDALRKARLQMNSRLVKALQGI